jgi:hypothetical protein
LYPEFVWICRTAFDPNLGGYKKKDVDMRLEVIFTLQVTNRKERGALAVAETLTCRSERAREL